MPGSRMVLTDRQTIERMWSDGYELKDIAVAVGRHPSTVGREIGRYAGRGGVPFRRMVPAGQRNPDLRGYLAVTAQAEATRSARRPKPRRLDYPPLAEAVTMWLELDWSPQQIQSRLPMQYPCDEAMRVSHEAIYRSLFVQGRGGLRAELTAHLRTGRAHRRARSVNLGRGRLSGMVPISARPAEATDRAVPGHWEGDLVLGGLGKGAVITLVERHSRFLLIAPLPHLRTAPIAREALTTLISGLPEHLRRSLTWDQGKEMAEHATFTIDTELAVYFADPHSPWQRGSNENTNGLLRQYLPKGCDMRTLTQADCDHYAQLLNTRPRETLNWHTPAEVLNRTLIATTA